jgi:hypothetical protein
MDPSGWSLRESIAAQPPGWPLLAYLWSGCGRRYGAVLVAVSGSAEKIPDALARAGGAKDRQRARQGAEE